MTRSKILGLALGASLLLGYEPIAEATPMAASPSVIETSAFSGNVTQVLLGIQRRHERRVERRVHRKDCLELARRLHQPQADFGLVGAHRQNRVFELTSQRQRIPVRAFRLDRRNILRSWVVRALDYESRSARASVDRDC